MTELLPFLWTFLAAALLGAALAAAGAHLATRQRTLQSLCLAQGAEMGALVGIVSAHCCFAFVSQAQTWLGLGGSLLGALLAGAVGSCIGGQRGSSLTPRLFGYWLALIAVTHLGVALHPLLESHLARLFIGDLGTLSDLEALIISVFAAICLCLLLLSHSTFARHTFDIAVLGKNPATGWLSSTFLYDLVPFLFLPALSTWGAGFLLTCGMLFIPTAMLAESRDSAVAHVRCCALLGALSGPVGLFISLQVERIPTVPAILATLVLACGFLSTFRVLQRKRAP